MRGIGAAGVGGDFFETFILIFLALFLETVADSLDEKSVSELAGETFLGPSESVALVSELTVGLFLVSVSEAESLSESDEESDPGDAGRGTFLAGVLLGDSDSEPELELDDDSLDGCSAFLVAGLLTEF